MYTPGEAPKGPSEESIRASRAAEAAVEASMLAAREAGLDTQYGAADGLLERLGPDTEGRSTIDTLQEEITRLFSGELESLRIDQIGTGDYEGMDSAAQEAWKDRADQIIARAEKLGEKLTEAVEHQKMLEAQKVETLKQEFNIQGELSSSDSFTLQQSARELIAAERAEAAAKENSELGPQLIDRFSKFAKANPYSGGMEYDFSRLSPDDLKDAYDAFSQLKMTDKETGGREIARTIYYPPGEDKYVEGNGSSYADMRFAHDRTSVRELQWKTLQEIGNGLERARATRGIVKNSNIQYEQHNIPKSQQVVRQNRIGRANANIGIVANMDRMRTENAKREAGV
jgi:hypothetical protein